MALQNITAGDDFLNGGIIGAEAAGASSSLPFWDKNTDGYEGDTYSRDPYELVTLGEFQLPGRCTVEALPERLFDRQKVRDRDGAALILRGYLPGPIDLEWTIWTPEQWKKAQVVLSELWPKAGKLADTQKGKTAAGSQADVADMAALPISHPMLQVVNVQRVVIRGISVPKPGSIPGSYVINIKCLEYVPTSKKKTDAKAKGVPKPPLADVPNARNAPGNPPSATAGSTTGAPVPPQSGSR